MHPGQHQLFPCPQVFPRSLISHLNTSHNKTTNRRGFRALEQRSAHVASCECTRVQHSVRLLPEGRGWQGVLCNQHIQRRDVNMHMRAHSRG